MIDELAPKPYELIEVERFINDLMEDTKHPLHNKRHPYHKDSVLAFNDLVVYANQIRNSFASV